MHFTAVIPARLASVRFPAKALASLCGKPIIQHVYEAVVQTGLFDRVLIATDAKAIMDCVQGFKAEAIMTSEHHQSGSDRVAEAILSLATDVVFNVQGDEPLIDQDSLRLLCEAFMEDGVEAASLMTEIQEETMLLDPNVVKVITDLHSNAIYFSRSPIPYNRDKDMAWTYMRHIGVYAYRKEALLRYVKLPQTPLEKLEKLEQLRLIENGIPIRMIKTSYQGIGIDTPQDLLLVQKLMQEKVL